MIVDSMSRDRAALQRAVLGLSRNQTSYRPTEGVWSIDDILHHLALTDEATAKLMAHFERIAEETNVPEDPSPQVSALGSIDSITPEADQGTATAPERVTPRSSVSAEDAFSRLWSSREKMLARVETLAPLDARRLTYTHPFFGELDSLQWLLITGWHERRHTRQIERLKTSEGFPPN